MQAYLLIPKFETSIIPGSAIVSSHDNPELCHYEGNLFNAANLHGLWNKALHAAGRMALKYPTTAVCRIPETDTIKAATLRIDDPFRLTVETVLDPDSIQIWSGESIDTIFGTRWDHSTTYQNAIEDMNRLDIRLRSLKPGIVANRWGDRIKIDPYLQTVHPA